MALQQNTHLESPSEGLKITGSGVTQKYLDLEGTLVAPLFVSFFIL